MILDVAALSESLHILHAQNDRFVERFFDLLFSRLPRVKPLFLKADLQDQTLICARALEVIVLLADDSEKLMSYLNALGARHVTYGVSPSDFPTVIAPLLEAMEEAVGREAWRVKYRAAWMDALGAIISGMCIGAASVSCPEEWDADEFALGIAGETPPVAPQLMPVPFLLRLAERSAADVFGDIV